ncbi:MAG TPA: hypothetical protein VKZ63_09810, partial [Kofleriaceae bacterium]|nr:hypothetical protein [Kofleriaceae bacterium]
MRSASATPLALAAVPCLLASLSSPAAAGPLAEVSRGIDNKADTHSSGSSSSSSSSHSSSEPDYTVDYDDGDCCTSSVYVVGDTSG